MEPVGTKSNQEQRHDNKRRQPIKRDNTQEPVGNERRWASFHVPVGIKHNESGDYEKNINPDCPEMTVPFSGVIGVNHGLQVIKDDQQGCDSPQELNV